MKTKRVVTESVEAEGLRMQWTCADGEAPAVVHLELDGGPVAIPAEMLERAAGVVRKARERTHAAGGLCLAHGYHPETKATNYRCPKCEPLHAVPEAKEG